MTNKKAINDALREKYRGNLVEMLMAAGEEVLVTASNTVVIPVVDSEGYESYVRFTVSVPTGGKDDYYDPYGEAEEYRAKQVAKEERAKEREAASRERKKKAGVVKHKSEEQ